MTIILGVDTTTLRARAEKFMRTAFYRLGIYRLLKLQPEAPDPLIWDKKLAGDFRSYLGGSISITLRNCLVRVLIKEHHQAGQLIILDVGCAGGSLGHEMAGGNISGRYIGVDISAFAIETAQEQATPNMDFYVSSLQDFVCDGPITVAVYNEVLYYLPPEEALHHVDRINQNLSDDGIMIVSMKNDVKSEIIFKLLVDHYTYISGVLFQEKPFRPIFKVVGDAARPGYLICVFRKKYKEPADKPT